MKYILTFFYALIFSGSVFSQATYVFFGSYNKDTGTDGIYVYNLNMKTGKLKKISANNSVFNPSYLTLSPNGKYLYACTESQTKNAGSVSSYAFDPANGTLHFLNSQKSGGENPVYLSTDQSGRWLVNANYTEGSISVFPLSEDGRINPEVQLFHFTEGSTVNPKRQDRSHVHSAVFSPNQNQVFFPDLGADLIRSYSFDSLEVKPLHNPNSISSIAGSGPRHLAFHPNGKFAYCIEELAGAVSVYEYNSGRLHAIQRIFTHPEGYKGAILSSDIHVSPDGKFLYASNRGDQNNFSIFSIDTDGKLTSIGYKSSRGVHPRTFAIDPSGKFLIATNMISGNSVVFRRNIKTGSLTKTGNQIRIKNVSTVKVRQY